MKFMRNESSCRFGQNLLVRVKRTQLLQYPVFILSLFALLNAFGQQPAFVSQPQSQVVSAGASFTLTAGVTGIEPLRYQWQKNGRSLSSGTNPSLQFSNVTPLDTGSYSLLVRNAYGSAISGTARVEVNAPSAKINPISVTGWNQSVIVDNSLFPFVTADFDNFSQFWFEAGWLGHEDGLPRSGRFTSQFNTNVICQFQSYESNNVLRLDFSPDTPTATLTLATPAPYHSLALLAASGNGGGNASCVLNFTDGTGVSNLNFVALDWYALNTNLAMAGLGRETPGGYQNAVTGFGMFETDFDLRAMGLDGKFLKSITFTKASNASVTGVFAISGEPNLSVNFKSISVLPDGRAQVTLSGFPRVSYRIDSSTNLIDWVPVIAVSNPSGTSQVIDAGAINQIRLFYRAVIY